MKLPVLSGHEVIKALSKGGFEVARRKSSHIIMVKRTETGKVGVVVPDHREIDKGTLLEIIRQAGMTKEEFIRLTRK